MIYKSTFGVVCICLTAFLHVASANAASLVYSFDSKIEGVNGINALGGSWNVKFSSGSYNSVYGLAPPLVTDTGYSANILKNELAIALHIYQPNLPADFVGCISISGCTIFTPSSEQPDLISASGSAARIHINGFPQSISGNYIINRSINFDNITIATWELTSVPVPAAVWLFGSGLIGLVGIARRKA